jgi:hypothetical protein
MITGKTKKQTAFQKTIFNPKEPRGHEYQSYIQINSYFVLFLTQIFDCTKAFSRTKKKINPGHFWPKYRCLI